MEKPFRAGYKGKLEAILSLIFIRHDILCNSGISGINHGWAILDNKPKSTPT